MNDKLFALLGYLYENKANRHAQTVLEVMAIIDKYKFDKMKVEQIAQVAHELNKAYCESLGDNSQPSWEDAPEW